MQLSMVVKIELNAQTRAGLAEAATEAATEDVDVLAGKPEAIKTGDDGDDCQSGFRCECSLNDCQAIF